MSSTATERAVIASTRQVTRLRVRRAGSGRLHVDASAGLLVPRIVRIDEAAAHVVLVAGSALLLAGDDLELVVEVGAGARLELSDVAATVAYDGRGGRAVWRADLQVAEGAELTWHGQPFVVSCGADVDRVLHAEVAVGGRLRLRDTLVLGRHGETGGTVRARTRLSYAGSLVLAEDLDLRDGLTGLPGILRGARVVDQLVEVGPETSGADSVNVEPGEAQLVGPSPVAIGAVTPGSGRTAEGGSTDANSGSSGHNVFRTSLHMPVGRGTLTRWLGAQTHASPLP